MAKRKTSSAKDSSEKPAAKARKVPRAASAAALTAHLRRIDRQLLADFSERAKTVQKLAKVRVAEGEDQIDLPAESQRVKELLDRSRGPLDIRALTAIFRELHSGCRALVRQFKVAYLGPQFSYSHLAAIERFGQSCDLVPVATIAAVFEEVNRRHAKFGLVPIENSTDGRIVDTLEMFARLPVRICGELQMRIHHNLLGICPRSEVREVYSKPQALSQCRNWLALHLPHARTVEMASTTAAARLAVEKSGAAAIAGMQAAVNYDLDVLASNIEDNQENVTRFAVIGVEAGDRTGNDKTSLMFELPHQPGALADAMAIFKRNRLNLTWIESFPKQGTQNEYLFFVEMEGHQQDLRVRRAVASLQRKAVRLEILGSYAKTVPVD